VITRLKFDVYYLSGLLHALHLTFLDVIILIMFGKEYKVLTSSLYSHPGPAVDTVVYCV